MAAKKKGIFCLEGAWWGVKDKTSVEPMLRLLEAMGDYEVPYFHHDVATHEEFDFYLKKWRGRSLAELDLLVLGYLQEVSFTKPGMQKFRRLLMESAPGLQKALKFRMWPEVG